jgi:hypothetical protein
MEQANPVYPLGLLRLNGGRHGEEGGNRHKDEQTGARLHGCLPISLWT